MDFLKHAAGINPGIIIEPGSRIITTAIDKTVIATAEVAEVFPEKVIFSDVNKFLAAASMTDDADFEFGADRVTIKSPGRRQSTVFHYGVPEVVKQPLKLPGDGIEYDACLGLESQQVRELFKAVQTLGVENIIFSSDASGTSVTAADAAIKSSNTWELGIGPSTGTYRHVFKRKNMKLMPEYGYDVEISSRGIAKFTVSNSPFKSLVSWIAVEAPDA